MIQPISVRIYDRSIDLRPTLIRDFHIAVLKLDVGKSFVCTFKFFELVHQVSLHPRQVIYFLHIYTFGQATKLDS